MRYRINLLDTWIDKTDLADAVSRIDAFVRSGVPHQVVTANVDFLRLGRQDPAFRDLINTADLVVPDGMPLPDASSAKCVTLAGMLNAIQCQKPLPVGASVSNSVTT